MRGLERLQYGVRNILRRRGFEVVRVHPNPSLLALHVGRLLRRFEIDLVLDVGARVGDYGAWLRHNGFTGRIVSFEPVEASFVDLRRRSEGDPNWKAVNVALGASSEAREINVTGLTYFSSFLEPNDYSRTEFGRSSAVQRSERVQIRRLDDLRSELDIRPTSRVYLKMDTQGWDLEVLRGARECLPLVHAIQSEVSVLPIYDGIPSWTESIAEFARLGFALSGLFPVNLDSKMRVIEFDCVAVRPDACDSATSSFSR
jgi:FkbM family methyltransferase